MTRLPAFFRAAYLSEEQQGERLSGLPSDLARFVDSAAPPGASWELSGTVLSYLNPKVLSDGVGSVSTSIVPAALDEVLRRSFPTPPTSYFLDMFAVIAIDTPAEKLLEPAPVVGQLLLDALYDHFEELSRTLGDGRTSGLDEELTALVAECAPELGVYEVTFRFGARRARRGARLLGYLFDRRPPSLTPAPWPRLIRL
jgi:hypothetical protein